MGAAGLDAAVIEYTNGTQDSAGSVLGRAQSGRLCSNQPRLRRPTFELHAVSVSLKDVPEHLHGRGWVGGPGAWHRPDGWPTPSALRVQETQLRRQSEGGACLTVIRASLLSSALDLGSQHESGYHCSNAPRTAHPHSLSHPGNSGSRTAGTRTRRTSVDCASNH